MYKRQLQDGMEVDCAYDGEEALNMAKANSYDMILLDVMLPKMDGFEAVSYTHLSSRSFIARTLSGRPNSVMKPSASW